jgi:hypothetical protein
MWIFVLRHPLMLRISKAFFARMSHINRIDTAKPCSLPSFTI